MFRSIAELVTRRGWVVVLAWAAAALALAWFAPSWGAVSQDDNVRFFPPGYPSVVGQGLLERGFPEDTAGSQVVVIAERPDAPMTEADLAFVDRLVPEFEALGREHPDLGVQKVVGRKESAFGDRLVATRPGGGQVVLTAVLLRGTFASKEARLAVDQVLGRLDRLRADAPSGLKLSLTGPAAVGHDSNSAANDSIHATTVATVSLVIGILLIVYRSPLLALIPLATIALSAFTALKVIAAMAMPPFHFQVINVTQVFVIVVLFGAGTDYCLFLIARYREELARGRTRNAAIAEAIQQVGGALVASAGTVIIGLGMLWFSTFAKIQFTGPSIALSLGIALLAALTLSPVLLRIIGPAVFWPFRPPHHVQGADPEEESLEETPMYGFWAGVADAVVRRPGLILAASLLVLAPFAWIGTQTRSSYDMLGDLGPEQPSVVGTTTFRQYYPEGELGPSTVLVRHPEIDFTTSKGMAALRTLSERLAALPGVVEVRSLTRPLGQPLELLPLRPESKPAKPANGGGLLGQFGQIGKGLQDRLEQIRRDQEARAFEHYVSMGRRSDLRLMSSVSDVRVIPTEGENLIVLAEVRGRLQVRIFDSGGKMVVDADQDRWPQRATQIASLRSRLQNLWNLRQLSRHDKDEIIDAVASIVGLELGPKVAPADLHHITRLDVVFDVSPFSEEAMDRLDRVQAVVRDLSDPDGPLAGAEAGMAGTTVQIADLKTVTTADEHRMYVLVTLGVYAILVVLLRRPGICLYLIATVVIGYLASLGLTDLVFRALHHGPTPWMGLDWKVGFFLFVILVAVGEDYNIFLMSRVIEEERKHGPIEGTRRAVAHTGGIISSCGLIMAGTFLAMLFGSLTTLKELGFALGVGVLLDTFIVRPVLVPAFVILWHRTRPSEPLEAPGFPSDEAEPAATTAS